LFHESRGVEKYTLRIMKESFIKLPNSSCAHIRELLDFFCEKRKQDLLNGKKKNKWTKQNDYIFLKILMQLLGLYEKYIKVQK
jgi:hypothetical protein